MLVELVAKDDETKRDLFVLELAAPEDLPARLGLSSPRFACLIAWDAHGVSVDRISRLARSLMASGAVYVCAWGPDCERVHDIFDEEFVGSDPPPVFESVVMTTWHSREPLSDAIFFVLRCSSPDDGNEVGCDSTLGLSIGSEEWASEIRAAFNDPDAFVERVCSEE